MAKQFHSPTNRTAAAAAGPARLAEECDGTAFWRERWDGELEVATVKDGYLRRHVVHDDGMTTLIESVPPPSAAQWAPPLLHCGVAVCLVGFVASAVSEAVNHRGMLLVVPGLVMVAVGALGMRRANLLKRMRRRRDGAGGEWHEACKLDGWTPQSAPQLAAVERLADANGGVARVRDAGAAGVDVQIRPRVRVRLYCVDPWGRAERRQPPNSAMVDRMDFVARALSFPLLIAGAIIWTELHDAGKPLAVALLVLAVSGFVLSFRSRGPCDDGTGWHTVQTKWDDDD